MSDYQIDYTPQLNAIQRQVQAVAGLVTGVAAEVSRVDSEVQVVDSKVVRVYNDLVALQNQFNLWVKEQRNANNFQRSLTEIVRVRQELEQKFGKHAEARKRLHGILDTADTGLLREYTIASCSEQIMLDTPKYWLSPCLVALAAWISNDKDLTDKAIKVALDRDVEKATLLFALVSRRTVPAGTAKDEASVRAARQKACFNWLDGYFKCQNPLKMAESVIVLIDSWANNVFGEDSGNICAQTFDGWMDAIAKDNTNFKEEQVSHWYTYYTYYNESIANQAPTLARTTPEFSRIEEYVQRLNAAPKIQYHFDSILSQSIDKNDLINRLDEQLESLISEFDPEEEGLRQEEIHHQLVKAFEGDADKVKREELKRAKKKNSEKVSLAQRLEDVVRSKDSKYAAARKTALKEKFLGRYVKDAYAAYITDKKEAFPEEITVCDGSGWAGKTKDGANEKQLVDSYTAYSNGLRQRELDSIDRSKIGRKTPGIILMIVGAIAAIALFALAGAAGLLGIIAVIAGFLLFKQGKTAAENAAAQENQINKKYDDDLAFKRKLIAAALAEWRNILAFVAEFQNNPKNFALDLTEKSFAAPIVEENAIEIPVEADELSLESLESEGEEEIDEDEELVKIDGEEDHSLTQSTEFLRQFATQFSTKFVLDVPQINFAEKKAFQDSKKK